MREILFRGKAINGGQWLYGHFTEYAGTSQIWTATDDGTWNSIVDPATVGQYTGLTDKNGVKIFEGDIVKLKNSTPKGEWIAVVEFGNPNASYSWSWQLKYLSGDNFNRDVLLWVDMEECGATCEVIGNIHDNPELLKEVAEHG